MSLKAKENTSSPVRPTPAPDRTQCPPDAKVRSFAKGEITGDTALEQHIQDCPWCARELKDHERDLEWNRFVGRSTKASYLVILAIIIFEVFRHISKK